MQVKYEPYSATGWQAFLSDRNKNEVINYLGHTHV